MALTAVLEPVEDSRLGALPAWDLRDLYPGPDSAELARAQADAEAAAAAFAARYQGKLATLEGEALGEAVAEYERIDELLTRVAAFADLVYATGMNDSEVGRFAQALREKVTDISSHLVFFALELNRLGEGELTAKLKAPRLARFAPWLRDVRVFRDHQLSDDMERMLHEKQVAGRAAWVRLFDETVAALRFPVAGKTLTAAEALHLLSEPDAALRKEAATAIGSVLADNVRLFALITNTLAKDKEIEDRWRRYPRPMSARNLGNYVEDDVVDALVTAVRAA